MQEALTDGAAVARPLFQYPRRLADAIAATGQHFGPTDGRAGAVRAGLTYVIRVRIGRA